MVQKAYLSYLRMIHLMEQAIQLKLDFDYAIQVIQLQVFSGLPLVIKVNELNFIKLIADCYSTNTMRSVRRRMTVNSIHKSSSRYFRYCWRWYFQLRTRGFIFNALPCYNYGVSIFWCKFQISNCTIYISFRTSTIGFSPLYN